MSGHIPAKIRGVRTDKTKAKPSGHLPVPDHNPCVNQTSGEGLHTSSRGAEAPSFRSNDSV